MHKYGKIIDLKRSECKRTCKFTLPCLLFTDSSELLLTGNLFDLCGSMLELRTEFLFPVVFTTVFVKPFQLWPMPIRVMRKMIDNNFYCQTV